MVPLIAHAITACDPADTTRIQSWYRQAYAALNNHPLLADSLISLGLSAATQLNDQARITDGLFLQACLLDNRAENEQAIAKLTQVLNRYVNQPQHQPYLIETYGRLGLLYNKKGNSNQALNYLLQGMELAEQQNRPKDRLHLLIVLAMHHNDYTKNFDRAAHYLKQAETLAGQLKESKCLPHIYLQYSVCYRYQGQIDRALYYCRLAAQRFQKTSTDANVLRARFIEAGIYTDTQNATALEKLLQTIEPLALKVNNWQIKGNMAFFKAQLLYMHDAYPQALQQAKEALHAFQESADVLNQLAVKALLGHLYLLQGNRQTGDSLLRILNHATDSNYANQIARYDAEMRQKYESVKRERELEQKEENLTRAKQQRMVLAGSLILLIAFSTVYYKRYQDNKEYNNLLNEKNLEIERQNRMLQKTNAQNELLLREIHHRVKNNLQLACSLLNMQLRSTPNPEAVSALEESASRLQSMLLVHQELYDKDNLGLVNMMDYSQNLTEFLLKCYNHHGYEIQPTIYINNINLSTKFAISIGLILTELITNSMKYAKPHTGEILHIGIELSAIDDSTYCLFYSDNGMGLPAELDISNVKTMGLRLVRDLTKQLRGRLSYQYDGATTFIIEFKKNK